MVRYTLFTGASFLTVRMKELKREKQKRSWQLTLAPLRRLLSRLKTPNSAVAIWAATYLAVLPSTYV